MTYTIYSATGCARCNMAKRFMNEQGIEFVEKDIKADGKEDYRKFYAANRSSIYRGPDGIEFPIVTDGREIRQTLGVVLAWLSAGTSLDGYFRIGTLHGEWIDGIDISGGNPAKADEFLDILRYLKKNSLKTQVTTNGGNASLLDHVLSEKLADRIVMSVLGPLPLYEPILNRPIDPEDVKKSIALVPQFPEYQFETIVLPVVRPNIDPPVPTYLTPEEIADIACLIKECTGGNKHPYRIKPFNPESTADQRLTTVEGLEPTALFKYRTAARAHQVFTEIEK
jgi:glutaredoxin/pyruvate-formate lyase-activating enzyme